MFLPHGKFDWSTFSNEEMLFFLQTAPNVLGGDPFARELCCRNFFPPEVQSTVLQLCGLGRVTPTVPIVVVDAKTALKEKLRLRAEKMSKKVKEMNTPGLCRLAVHNVELFAALELQPSTVFESEARAFVLQAVGRWRRRYHRYLPRPVQQVALLVLWALTKRVGTRHIVYMILERGLVFDNEFHEMSVELFQAVVQLMRS